MRTRGEVLLYVQLYLAGVQAVDVAGISAYQFLPELAVNKGIFLFFAFFLGLFLGRSLHPCVTAAPRKGKHSVLPNPVPLPAITSEL